MSRADLVTLIRNRRSVREFTGEPVPDPLVRQIVECGLAAPSSKNSNPWFIVTVSGEVKTRIAAMLADAANTPAGLSERSPIDPRTGSNWESIPDTVMESVDAIGQCHTLILIFNRAPFSRGIEAVLAAASAASPSVRGQALYGYAGEMLGIGAAVENMLLAATALGLGAVYLADSYPARHAVKSMLRTTKELVGAIAVGYPADVLPPRELRSELVASWDDAVGRIDESVSEGESSVAGRS